MNIWVTSDTHLGHKRLIEWGRPEDFEYQILNNLHDTLDHGDYLIHLGDVCIGQDEKHHEILMGATQKAYHRLLVRGNHDKKSTSWYLSHGWSAVVDQATLNIYGYRVLFSHVPVDQRLWADTDVNVHGHTHGNAHRDRDVKHFLDESYHREIALENTNYRPVLLTEKFLKGSTK